MTPKNIIQVRKHIQKKYPDLNLIRGKGYFYFVSDTNEKLSYDLNSKLDTTSVLVCNIYDLTLDQWLLEADEIMTKIEGK